MSKVFKDPLQDIDPVMEEAFSYNSEKEEGSNSVSNYAADDFLDESFSDDVVSDDFDSEDEVSVDASQQVSSTGDKQKVMNVKFPSLTSKAVGQQVELDALANIPIEVSVELGRAKISLKELFELSEGSIVDLKRLVGEPIDLVVDSQIIAQGEVVSVDRRYGLKITSIVSDYQSS